MMLHRLTEEGREGNEGGRERATGEEGKEGEREEGKGERGKEKEREIERVRLMLHPLHEGYTSKTQHRHNILKHSRYCTVENVPVEMWDIFSARPAFSTAATESQ